MIDFTKMDYGATSVDLYQAKDLLQSRWQKQNDRADGETNFIYFTNKLSTLLELCEQNSCNSNYVIHRWYNWICSRLVEQIFCDLGCTHEENEKSHEVDIYLPNGIPIDIKLTVLPKQFLYGDIYSRQGRNRLIEWFYNNQSNEKRHHNGNKIYIVCKAQTPIEANMLKCDFDLIRQKVRPFIQYIENGYDMNNFSNVFLEAIIVEE